MNDPQIFNPHRLRRRHSAERRLKWAKALMLMCACAPLSAIGRETQTDAVRPPAESSLVANRLPALRRPTRLPSPTSPSSAGAQEVSPIRSTGQARDRFTKQSASQVQLASANSAEAHLSPPVTSNAVPQTLFDTNRFQQSIAASLVALQSPCPVEQSYETIGGTVDCGGGQAGCAAAPYADDFSPTPIPESSMYHDSGREQWVYDSKHDVPTQHPWVEWGRIFYGDGITPRGRNWWGSKNLGRPEFYVYGDYRTAIATGRNAAGRTDNWANRLNLDFDLQLTDTERFHAFVGPLDKGAQVTRWERIGGDWKYREELDLTPVTGYFEGDLGVIMGAFQDRTSPFELPITIGLVPLLFQNGIWMEDAVTGAAFALPARHSRLLNWSNYDATFFAVVDQLNSPAFAGQKHAAQAFGTAWFIEAYGGYIETGYAYLRDRNFSGRSYHNITASFTRRYLDRISNSVRVIINTGQDLPQSQRTADGVLLLVENSLITASPLTVVPYANFFVGWDRPQSVARAGVSGGILRNTGINFDTDGVNGLATLDTTASDTAGGSIGVDLLGRDLDRQLLLEIAYLTPHGSSNAAVADDQFAAGARYQFPISHRTLLRFDTMYGWRRGLEDVYGTRMEYRWKF